MTDKELAEIRARCEAATLGPWAVGRNRHLVYGSPEFGCIAGCESESPEDDADFIAHARSDIPALLAEVEALREELATKTRWAEQVERQFFMARDRD